MTELDPSDWLQLAATIAALLCYVFAAAGLFLGNRCALFLFGAAGFAWSIVAAFAVGLPVAIT